MIAVALCDLDGVAGNVLAGSGIPWHSESGPGLIADPDAELVVLDAPDQRARAVLNLMWLAQERKQRRGAYVRAYGKGPRGGWHPVNLAEGKRYIRESRRREMPVRVRRISAGLESRLPGFDGAF